MQVVITMLYKIIMDVEFDLWLNSTSMALKNLCKAKSSVIMEIAIVFNIKQDSSW